MRRILTAIAIAITVSANAKIVYVDNHDEAISANYQTATSIRIDVDRDGENDLELNIRKSSGGSCTSTKNGSVTSFTPFIYQAWPLTQKASMILADADGLKIDQLQIFQNTNYTIAMTSQGQYCDGVKSLLPGPHKLGFRLAKTNPATGKNGFIYGYVDYTLTTSGDIVVHGWHYNDAFNEPIIANSNTPYPYNGCTYQDTVKTYVTVNVYDTVKVPKTVYDTVKVTKIEIVKKTVYDTIKVTHHDTIHKVLYDTTKITHHDTVTKTLYDTIKTHVTVHDTVTKTIYQTVKVNVYDTIQIPTAVHDTLVASLGKNTGQRLRMWPNPASQTITLDLSSPDPANVLVIDQAGTTVADFPTRTQITTLDAGQWAQGTYTVTVTQGNNQTTKHIQINR